MKIVIDIPDDSYKRIVKDGMTVFGSDADIAMMDHALENASPTIGERKTGKWVVLHDEYGDVVEAVCSLCDMNGNHTWQYCPNCGARMEGAEE